MDYSIKLIKFGSSGYAETLRLREAVLRRPLGTVLQPEDTASDSGEIHITAWDADRLAGVLLLRPLDSVQVKMRQVAVEPELQGRGIGRRMVEFSEGAARALGYREIVLHARKTAAGFYEKLGYSQEGGEFLEIGLPHVEMLKRV